MKLSSAISAMTYAAAIGKGLASPAHPDPIPEIKELMDLAFPKWIADNDGNRIEHKACTVDSCEWNPFYTTARWDGLHPDFGGGPTDNDVQYPFYASAPFRGQPYGGTSHHCADDAPYDVKMNDCPKIETLTDDGPQGPGLIPPHISLVSLTRAVQDKLFSMEEMFDFESFQCRVIPGVLLTMVRTYYPRTEGSRVVYPKPYTPEGGDYQYEFPSGRGVDNMAPPYEPGSPHWCEEELQALGFASTFCPYLFAGPDKGRYRRPHVAFASLEVYLANIALPDRCHRTWLQNNPSYLDESRVADGLTTDKPFPAMTTDDADRKTVANWIGQPVLPWNYSSCCAKDATVMLAEVTRSYLNFTQIDLWRAEIDSRSSGHALGVNGAVTAATGSAAALIGCAVFFFWPLP